MSSQVDIQHLVTALCMAGSADVDNGAGGWGWGGQAEVINAANSVCVTAEANVLAGRRSPSVNTFCYTDYT